MKRIQRIYPTFFLIILSGCGDSGTGPGNSGDIRATFSSIQAIVFTQSCAFSGCHGDIQQPNLSAGVAYGNIVNMPSIQGLDYIAPGNPSASYLYLKIVGTNISGDRMPKGASPLRAAVIDSVRAWIAMGAPNN